ncbi:NAD(P)-dependent dehydrogenase (short-subunit alcohol dehydrogenase family) [Kineothrix alysoides]|uniref:NAD(P)-dependent dehydrogenase (Short-subunit alcohol dehydrogenase family) n=1 Tax=Kineothrix alysoides TaxID=1469948 RepID=A0A4R1QU49_9FIRM|nr:SDR family NAD(P)-dependent oxidoreductase [Kineothrix alysoides]TCL56673.1 NAD(P)-dependent dehydrogenase (short-subunit alcohol dehydrogenase family) [Kineothrix alysoides]
MDDKKTVVITGANSGLGFECAQNIAHNTEYCIILACRDTMKAEQAKADLIQISGNPHIEAMELDVSSFASIRAFVSKYKELNLPLYGLVCNAGINGTNIGKTSDGFDIVFETNHLGHFLLTNLLLPSMLPSGRIAVVSSDMHDPPGAELTWPGTAAIAGPDETLEGNFVRYSYSKLCNLYFTYELSARLIRIGAGIIINAFNPGLMIDTGFAPDKSRFTESFLQQVSDRIGSLEKSALALSQIITDPYLARATGKYFDRGIEEKRSSSLSYDMENALELWNTSAAYAKLTRGETLQGLLY